MTTRNELRAKLKDQTQQAARSTLNTMNMTWCFFNRPEWLKEWNDKQRKESN